MVINLIRNKKLFICGILLSILGLTSAVMDKDKVVFAVNCGGEEFEDSNGINFVKVIRTLFNKLYMINNCYLIYKLVT